MPLVLALPGKVHLLLPAHVERDEQPVDRPAAHIRPFASRQDVRKRFSNRKQEGDARRALVPPAEGGSATLLVPKEHEDGFSAGGWARGRPRTTSEKMEARLEDSKNGSEASVQGCSENNCSTCQAAGKATIRAWRDTPVHTKLTRHFPSR
ncbi:hypothetical protein NUW54_g6631 [Trametes sanguinea]|uniref:Uncharacterized protein n=1 Tax=Trametes sanguinea TaxID=158606 RepID=A0ACC1PT55_9APHY|nr:hypothetical protein NUW54_g6631 [Trametes sanguinea]